MCPEYILSPTLREYIPTKVPVLRIIRIVIGNIPIVNIGIKFWKYQMVF